jgi:hypothetical protein
MMVVTMMVMMMMVRPGSEHRTCERHQQQSSRKYSLHGTHPSMVSIAGRPTLTTHVFKEQRWDCDGSLRICASVTFLTA